MTARPAHIRLLVLIAFTLTALLYANAQASAQDPLPVVISVVEGVGVSTGSTAVPPQTTTLTEQVSVGDFVTLTPPAVISVIEQIRVSDFGGPVNSAPQVDAGSPLTTDEGSTAVLTASVIVLDPQLTTAIIDWGDGSATDQVVPTTAGGISASHLYANDGDFVVSVTVTGLFGDSVSDTTLVEVINLAPIVETDTPYTIDLADPVSTVILSAVASDPGGDPITYAWNFDDDGIFDDATGQTALFPHSTVGEFTASVEVQDDLGAATIQSYTISVIDTGDDDDTPASDDSNSGSDSDSDDNADDDSASGSSQSDKGKVSGRVVIGRLVRMSNIEIVVAANVGADFTHVRVHIDSGATELAESLDAEAYATGSKIVVVADSDVLSGNATAVKIVPIPGTATRKHDRVIVSKPNDGNTVQLVSGDGGVSDSVINDDSGRYKAGDQVVVLTQRDNLNRGSKKTRVLVNSNDIKNRLEEFARTKFDKGDTGASGLIDRLAQERLDREQEKIDKAKRHADEAVRRAAELADEKAKRVADKDAADPVKAIRNKAVSDSENDIIECASRVVGRPVSGADDLSAAELRRVTAECHSDDRQDGAIPGKDDNTQRRTPPPELLECIVRVLGSVPNRAITAAEEVRLQAACSFDDEADEHDDDKSAKERADERNSTKSIDARKRAFCASNPADRHCTGGGSGSSDDKAGDSSTEADKRAFCAANPTDPRCAGNTTDKDDTDTKDGKSGSGDDGSKEDDRSKDDDSKDDGQTKGSDSKPPGK